jgi:hypothetical protein
MVRSSRAYTLVRVKIEGDDSRVKECLAKRKMYYDTLEEKSRRRGHGRDD